MTLPVLHSALLAELPHIRHGFFTRQGGVSDGLYDSLNCGPGSNDAPERVADNRARVAQAMGGHALLSLYQVHGAGVINADAALAPMRPEGDAWVVRQPGVTAGILTADCAPVLLADAHLPIAGAAHAGWKGAACGVLQAVVAQMQQAGATRILAAVGPCIGQASYEVDAGFRTRFLEMHPDHAAFFVAGHDADHAQFDLPGFVAAQLRACGVAEVEILPYDTCAEEARFFSFRRKTLRGEADYARQISCIALAG